MILDFEANTGTPEPGECKAFWYPGDGDQGIRDNWFTADQVSAWGVWFQCAKPEGHIGPHGTGIA